MKLDRNTNGNGSGKYALIRLRDINHQEEVGNIVSRLEHFGCLDWGKLGEKDEFFVIKLRDKYAAAALVAYAEAAQRDAMSDIDPRKAADKLEWAAEIYALAARAGRLSPFCKTPD
jgi:hypothetical protein